MNNSYTTCDDIRGLNLQNTVAVLGKTCCFFVGGLFSIFHQTAFETSEEGQMQTSAKCASLHFVQIQGSFKE